MSPFANKKVRYVLLKLSCKAVFDHHGLWSMEGIDLHQCKASQIALIRSVLRMSPACPLPAHLDQISSEEEAFCSPPVMRTVVESRVGSKSYAKRLTQIVNDCCMDFRIT